jgi:YVTN family beta-propeller protein
MAAAPAAPSAAVPPMAAVSAAALSTHKFGWATATVIPTGIKPEGIVASPDGKTIYVANNLSNTVSVINAADGTKIKDILIYNPPRWFQWGYHGKEPSKLAVSEDGKYLYVVNRGGKGNDLSEFGANLTGIAPLLHTPSLSVVDINGGYKVQSARISTLNPLSTISGIRQEVTGLAVGNGKLYLSNANDKNPSFGSFRGGEVTWDQYEVVERLAKEALQCTTSRCPYYEAGQMGTWSKIKSYALPNVGKGVGALVSQLPLYLDKIAKLSDLLSVRPADIAVAPDGGLNYVYSVNRANDFVYVFDPVTNVMVDAVYMGKMRVEDKTLYLGNGTTPIKMKFSPDGQTGYVLNAGSRELVRVDTDPSKIKAGRGVQVVDRTVVTDNPGLSPVDMAVTADGRYAIVLNNLSRFSPDGITSSLTIVDLADNKVVSSLPLYKPSDNVDVLELSVVGTKAFITTRSTKVYAANVRLGDVIAVDIPSSAFVAKA